MKMFFCRGIPMISLVFLLVFSCGTLKRTGESMHFIDPEPMKATQPTVNNGARIFSCDRSDSSFCRVEIRMDRGDILYFDEDAIYYKAAPKNPRAYLIYNGGSIQSGEIVKYEKWGTTFRFYTEYLVKFKERDVSWEQAVRAERDYVYIMRIDNGESFIVFKVLDCDDESIDIMLLM